MASNVSAEYQGSDDMMKILVGKQPAVSSDTERILFPNHATATDNHIGYMEKDPVRYNDSLESFEEILEIAKSQNVWTHGEEMSYFLTRTFDRWTSSSWGEICIMRTSRPDRPSTPPWNC